MARPHAQQALAVGVDALAVVGQIKAEDVVASPQKGMGRMVLSPVVQGELRRGADIEQQARVIAHRGGFGHG